VNICEQDTFKFGHCLTLSVIGGVGVDFERRRHVRVTNLSLCHSKRNAFGMKQTRVGVRSARQPIGTISASLHAGISSRFRKFRAESGVPFDVEGTKEPAP
jgi:hypothetical protein